MIFNALSNVDLFRCYFILQTLSLSIYPDKIFDFHMTREHIQQFILLLHTAVCK